MVSRLLTDRKGPRYRHSASCQSSTAGSLSPEESLFRCSDDDRDYTKLWFDMILEERGPKDTYVYVYSINYISNKVIG